MARNLPFVDHVALMGLEDTGFAIANADLLWVDPTDYRQKLAQPPRRPLDFRALSQVRRVRLAPRSVATGLYGLSRRTR